MGLEASMAGTAYLDDAIWPHYLTAYSSIPVLAASYPTESEIMAVNPDFIVASYASAFRHQYTRSSGSISGIYTNATFGPCQGTGSEWTDSDGNAYDWTTCRPQMHAAGVGTYLLEDGCEDASLRPSGGVTEDTVYDEMRALAAVFNVNPDPLIADMQADFTQAALLVSNSGQSQLKTVWLDCVGCGGCSDGATTEEEVYVGAGQGAPNMLMQEAGLTNVFAGESGNWACVTVSAIAAANPDVIVVVDASWDTAIEKIRYLYNDAPFCQMEVLRAARFVSIPFSATTLSPRNAPAAVDLATAALHVRTGSITSTRESGVTSFSPYFLQSETACSLCPLAMTQVIYDDSSDSASNYNPSCTTTRTTTTAVIESNGAQRVMLGSGLLAASLGLLASVF
jgi:iron complex transport system substrate-binding protein